MNGLPGSHRNQSISRIAGMIIAVVSTILLACNAAIAATPIPQRPNAAMQTPLPTTAIPTETPTLTPSATPIVVEDISTEVAYKLPLTVQNVTDTGAVLFCELSSPTEGILLYGPVEGDMRTQLKIDLDPQATEQQIMLDGLTPGIEYEAIIGLSAGNGLQQPSFLGEAWGAIRFRTESSKEPLRIGVLGDSGFGQPATSALAEQMAGSGLDAVIHTGDVVYNIEQNTDPYEAYALKYYAPFAPVLHEMPIYPVPGNHDVEQEAIYQGTPFYYHAFPPFVDARFPASDVDGLNRWYAIAYGNIQFLMLDTQTFFNEPGRAEQKAWLSERLADERFAYTIPVFHVAPFTNGLHPWDGLAIRSEWLPLFEQANVPLVFSGHDHNYERFSVSDITYIVTGGGSATLYAERFRLPETLAFAKQTHFVLLEIYRDRIELQAIVSDGEIIDKATISLDK